VMDYPAYRSTEAKKVYQDFENNFRMLGAGILTHQEETLYPKDFFFDSVYHLQSEARAKRTGLIISRLKENRALPAPGCAP